MAAWRPERVEPRPGQESAWDYPRPPAVVASRRHVRVEHAGVVVADSHRALRVLETAGAPVWYLPPDDVRLDLLRPARGPETVCEWKGRASYFDLVVRDRVAPRAAWQYAHPEPGYAAIAGCIAFYPGRIDAALVDGERAMPQAGGFYGGWVTPDVVGPFKGDPGTEGW
jgi:uncharacterized protein (DUF427 family)